MFPVLLLVLSVCAGSVKAEEDGEQSHIPTKITAAQQELLRRELSGVAVFQENDRIRLSYSFEAAAELQDWIEYPSDGGSGRWRVELGKLLGEGRSGLRHHWRFRGDLKTEVSYSQRPSGRIHLFDPGKGRGVAETDFHAIYSASNLVMRLPRLELPETASGQRVAAMLSLEKETLRYQMDGQRCELGGFQRERAGYLGLFCWGKPVAIEALTLEGELDSHWVAGECARQSILNKVESESRSGQALIPLLEEGEVFPWPWSGKKAPKKDRRRKFALEGGEDPLEIWIGSPRWENYAIEGRIILSPGGIVRVLGRSSFHRQNEHPVGVEFHKGTMHLLAQDASGSKGKIVETGLLEADRPISFRIEWHGDFLVVEVDGQQLLSASVKGAPNGWIRLQVVGEGSIVSDLRAGLSHR